MECTCVCADADAAVVFVTVARHIIIIIIIAMCEKTITTWMVKKRKGKKREKTLMTIRTAPQPKSVR